MTVSQPKHRKITRLIQHHWNSRADRFDEEAVHGVHSEAQKRAWLDVLARVAGAPPRQVLDVGCGTGVLTILLAELGHRVTGIDLAPQMLDRARQKARDAGLTVQLRMENAAEIGDPDGSYDLVVARHVVWTLPDPAGAVREWLRVLRSDGRVAIIEGHWSADRPMAEPRSLRRALAAFARVAARAVFYSVRPTQWGAVRERLQARMYQKAHTQLPFYGGPSADRLRSLLEDQGLRSVHIEPLMLPELWGEVPQHPRYLVVGRRERA